MIVRARNLSRIARRNGKTIPFIPNQALQSLRRKTKRVLGPTLIIGPAAMPPSERKSPRTKIKLLTRTLITRITRRTIIFN